MLGYPDQALKEESRGACFGPGLSHPYSLAHALGGVAELHQLRREARAAQERAEAAITLSSEQGFPFWLERGIITRGWALSEQGQGEEGIVQMRQGLAAYRATGAELWRPYPSALLAEAYGKVGQVEEGLTVLAEALAWVDRTEEHFYEAELYRLAGELSLRIGEPESGRIGDAKNEMENRKAGFSFADSPFHRFSVSSPEDCFIKAIEIAQRQQAKSLELRATVSLARLVATAGQERRSPADAGGRFTVGLPKDLTRRICKRRRRCLTN